MKPLLVSLLFACNTCVALAQHYVIAGGGFSLMQFDSPDLDLFQDTYNRVNVGFGQSSLLRGFDLGVGLSGEVSYRHIGKWSKAVAFGYQENSATDIAGFNNGVERNLKLTVKHFYFQPAFGFVKKNLFVDGLVTFYLKRKFTLNSRLSDEDQANPLTGIYKSTAGLSTDVGIAFGAISGPILLLAKISYPVRKAGKAEVLNDPSAAKVAAHLNAFPDDFIKYVDSQPYKGVASDIDGLKITISLNFAFSLSPLDEEER